MESPEDAHVQENEYMAMDDQQFDNNDDTYENGDTLGFEIGRRTDVAAQQMSPNFGRQGTEVKKKSDTDRGGKQLNALPLPERYITIRRFKPNDSKGRIDNLAFFRWASVGLLVLSLLLIGALVGLSIVYDRLAGIHLTTSMQIQQLVNEKTTLMGDLAYFKNISGSWYRVSTSQYPSCLSGNDLFIVNPGVLEEYMKESSFYLYYSTVYNGSCYNKFSWNCTC